MPGIFKKLTFIIAAAQHGHRPRPGRPTNEIDSCNCSHYFDFHSSVRCAGWRETKNLSPRSGDMYEAPDGPSRPCVRCRYSTGRCGEILQHEVQRCYLLKVATLAGGLFYRSSPNVVHRVGLDRARLIVVVLAGPAAVVRKIAPPNIPSGPFIAGDVRFFTRLTGTTKLTRR